MFCYKCGKEISDDADVCLGCGTLLHKPCNGDKELKNKSSNTSPVLFGLSIGNLIFCSAFAIFGLVSFFFFSTEGFAFRVVENFTDSYSIRTIWLMPSIISLLAVSVSAVSSIFILVHNGSRKLNIPTLCITALFFIIVAIIAIASF